jgi:hypothetical protein
VSTQSEKGHEEAVDQIRRRLTEDLGDSELRSLQLRMDVLDQWARLGDPRLAAGHDHDHMDDHDHAMRAEPFNVIVAGPEMASKLEQSRSNPPAR